MQTLQTSLEKETAHHHTSLDKVQQLEAVVSKLRGSIVEEERKSAAIVSKLRESLAEEEGRNAAMKSSLKDEEENSAALERKLQM